MYDQEELPANILEKDLIDAIAGRRPDLNRMTALKALLKRDSSLGTKTLRQTLTDETAPNDMRSVAAVALGKDASQENILLEGLKTISDPGVVRHIAQSLGRIGTPKTLDTLRNLRFKVGSRTARSIEFASSLISYRYGLGKNLIRRPAKSDISRIDPNKAINLNFEPLDPVDVKASLKLINQTLSTVTLSEKAATCFNCLGDRLWLLLNEEIVGLDAGRRLLKSNALIALVLKQNACLGNWYIFEYILSHPIHNENIEIFGVQPSGVNAHFGQLKMVNQKATVNLHALNTSYVLPLEFDAKYSPETATIEITKAITVIQPGKKQHRPTVPMRDNTELQKE